MAIAKEPEQKAINELVLTDENASHFGAYVGNPAGGVRDFGGEFLSVGIGISHFVEGYLPWISGDVNWESLKILTPWRELRKSRSARLLSVDSFPGADALVFEPNGAGAGGNVGDGGAESEASESSASTMSTPSEPPTTEAVTTEKAASINRGKAGVIPAHGAFAFR